MMDIIFPKLHKEGYRFLAIAAAGTFILLLISKFLGFLSLILTIWVYYFFRDPDRHSIENENFLISPADGVITQILEVDGPRELNLENKKYTRVSIFMSPLNCHVNRIPLSGKIAEIFYKPGKFLNASLDKASEENERNFIKLQTNEGNEIVVVQIAGFIARRIFCEIKKDQELKQGEKIGMIRFGSRVDLYFNNCKILVKEKQSTIAGETLIAKKD